MYDWKYAENKSQKYYDCVIDNNYLLVFANKWQPNIWMGMINNIMIRDKTSNDRQRMKQGLPKGCDTYLLQVDVMLCNSDPEYMKRRIEHCFKYNKTEVSR